MFEFSISLLYVCNVVSYIEHMQEILHLKAKIDAGADFVITQFFYSTDAFLSFVEQCRAVGIQCPIIPGIMAIQNYTAFTRMTQFCKTQV
jgi:methylenetetrahydrofolate reductase (NADPH)